MSVLTWFRDLVRREAGHYVYCEIPADRVSPSITVVPIAAEENYFRVWLAEMFLKDDQRLFRGYVPVVHSSVSLQFADKPAQELPYIAGPQNVGIGSTLGQGVQLDHALTNLLPYRGGMVSISTALLAYKHKDFLDGLLSVGHNISGLLNVGQLSAALKVLDGTIDATQSLLGAGDKDVHLVYFQSFGGKTVEGGVALKSGYTAIVKADTAHFSPNKLFVKDSRLLFGDSLTAAKPLTGYDYMLLRTEGATVRDDYLSFDIFKDLLKEAIREGTKDRAAGENVLRTAEITAWSSPDLTNADKVRVAKALRAEYAKVFGDGRTPVDLYQRLTEKAFNEAVRRISRKEAEDIGRSLTGRKPSFEEFLRTLN